jgi:hypothetical protein
VNLRVRAKKNGKTTTDLAAEMIREIACWLPERRFHLTGDGAYAWPARACPAPTSPPGCAGTPRTDRLCHRTSRKLDRH